MNFLDEAKKLTGEDDLEILDIPLLKIVMPTLAPEKTNKGKGVGTILHKRKVGVSAPSLEKLMHDALMTRSSKR